MSASIPVPSSIPHLIQDEIESPPLSLTKLTWLRFRRHKMAMFGGGGAYSIGAIFLYWSYSLFPKPMPTITMLH